MLQGDTEFKKNRRGLLIAFSVTAIMTLAEFAGGLIANSLALLSDAGHMLTDALAIGLSLFAIIVAQRPKDTARTYGYHRTEILAALFNGSVLIVVSGFIFYYAYQRFLNPPPVKTVVMLVVAGLGLVTNLAGIFTLKGSVGKNLNIRSAFLHILGDALSSVGVIIGGIIIIITGWYIIDPLIGAIIGVVIVRGAIGVLTESVDILLESAPRHLNVNEIMDKIKHIQGVNKVHDMHLWAITSGMYAMSVHILIDDQMLSKSGAILKEAEELLSKQFGITHTTIQLECGRDCLAH